MIKLSLPILAATLVATTSIALADEKADLLEKLRPYINAPRYYDEFGANEAGRFREDAAQCLPIVEQLRALGVEPNEQFAGYMAETWRFKQAPALCQKYREYQLVIRGGEAVGSLAGYLKPLVTDPEADVPLVWVERCVNDLDKLVADGLPTDAMISLGYNGTIKVSEAQAGCASLLAMETAKAEKNRKVLEERDRAEAAMWKKLGVSGDRLKLIEHKNAMTLGGPGAFHLKGCEYTSDPKKLAKAKVLREIFENDDGLTISVRSHFFKGNKLLKTTVATWPRGSMHAACK